MPRTVQDETAFTAGQEPTYGAGAGRGSDGAEGVQVVGQVGERDLDLVAAAEAGADGVHQAVAAGDHNCSGVGNISALSGVAFPVSSMPVTEPVPKS